MGDAERARTYRNDDGHGPRDIIVAASRETPMNSASTGTV